MRIGLVVNPFAGLGGAVGLKGTDGPGTVTEALRRGAQAKAGARARLALSRLADRVPGAEIILAAGSLGEDWARGLDLDTVITPGSNLTGTARDTKAAVRAMGALDVIVFAGGDGTARDVASVAEGAALLGIPCGVKMHSGVFAVSPQSAGAMMADLTASPDRITWADDAEVMDIDEEALRRGILAPRLYGYARVPVSCTLMQAAKGGPRQDAASALSSAARGIVDGMEDRTLYIIGPGTSAGSVMRAAGHTATPLGVDALLNRKRVAQDADDAALCALAEGRDVRVVLGVTGQQGFLLGRGNQQIGPALIAKAGRDGLIILATEDKLTSLAHPRLLIDTGDPDLDAELTGFVRVATGANREMMMRIASG
ncbi:NAD(+)/NADH kinase [Roseobacter sp. YSTF-M11]|uniref:NAD(+)/NADH kinase n=1 Tax=Roseobacter insulae TaxID=2859783 RepID=A0A9X1FWM8_9RHOB|nr:NAD(+)/NADH kinase [Roseobacter insulae]MBW4708415.1 NAD(+)/NADH kinase [Roseobacter insulae]